MEVALDLVLLGLPFVAAMGWWRLFGGTAAIYRALLTAFWTFAQLSGILALLGWIGALTPLIAVFTEVAITVLVWVFALRRPAVEAPPSPAPTRWERWALWTVGVVAGLILLRTLGYALLLPIDGSDGSSYHLPALIEALQNSDFRPEPSTVGPAQAGPKSVDMLFLWLMLGLHLDLVLFGQVLTIPIAIAAVAALAKLVGIRDPLAWTAGISVLFIPVVIAQLSTAYVDVGAGALFLAAVAISVLYLRGHLPPGWGAITTLAVLGFAAGAKFAFVVPTALLTLVVLGIDLKRRRLGWAHLIGMALLVIGAGWYINAWIEFDNPTYPYTIVEGLFPDTGWTVDDIVELELNYTPELLEVPAPVRPLLAWAEPGRGFWIYSFDTRLAGMGPLWPVIWAPAIAIWLIGMGLRRSWRLPLLLVAVFFGVLVIQTFPWWTRFTWWLAGLGMVAAAWIWQEGPGWLRKTMGGLYLAGALFVLVFTSVQGTWTADRVTAMLDGDDEVAQDAGPALAAAFRSEGETIAVPGQAWGSWNTYLRGDDFENEVVVVHAGTTEELVSGLIDTDATLAFQPADGPWWPLEALYSTDCLEEVVHDGFREQALFRVTCSA